MTAAMHAVFAANKSSGSMNFLFILVAVYALVYFLFLRPRQKKAREARAQGRQFEIGDTVQTIGGLIATIVAMDDKTVTVSPGPGQEMRFLKQAISGKFVEPGEEPEASETESDEPSDGTN